MCITCTLYCRLGLAVCVCAVLLLNVEKLPEKFIQGSKYIATGCSLFVISIAFTRNRSISVYITGATAIAAAVAFNGYLCST